MAGKIDLRIWVEGTVIAAMVTVLFLLSTESANSGLGLPLGTIPLVLYSFRRGLLPGVAAGFIWGMLNITPGTAMKNFLSVSQIIFEYPFAFVFGGVGGVLTRKIQLYFQANRLKSATRTIILGSVVAVFVRWFWHFWTGILVWGMYAPEGMSPYFYSSILSGTDTVVNCLYVSLILGSLAEIALQLLIPKKQVESQIGSFLYF